MCKLCTGARLFKLPPQNVFLSLDGTEIEDDDVLLALRADKDTQFRLEMKQVSFYIFLVIRYSFVVI